MIIPIKDSFLKTLNSILFNYNPTIATATVGLSNKLCNKTITINSIEKFLIKK